MSALDNYDRQLLGYLRTHPGALFREISGALGGGVVVADQRVQKLLRLGYLTMGQGGTFHLASQALRESTLILDPAEEEPPEFSWEELYIPRDFKG